MEPALFVMIKTGWGWQRVPVVILAQLTLVGWQTDNNPFGQLISVYLYLSLICSGLQGQSSMRCSVLFSSPSMAVLSAA